MHHHNYINWKFDKVLEPVYDYSNNTFANPVPTYLRYNNLNWNWGNWNWLNDVEAGKNSN